MKKDDKSYPLQPSGNKPRQDKIQTPWSAPFRGGESETSVKDDDDYTFTDDGLKDGVSVGKAKRYSPINPKYVSGQTDEPTSNSSTRPLTSNKKNQYTNPNEPFRGKTLGDIEDFLKGRLEYYKSLEESEEEREKRERREKHSAFLARLTDGLGAFHKAFSYARGVKPMDLPKMSEKATERFERAKAERDKNGDRIMNYAVMLDRLNNSKAQANYQQQMFEMRKRQQDRLDKQEDRNRDVANARAKLYAAQTSKNEEQAAYWKTKADLLEQGWPLEEAEKAARIAERKARAVKLTQGGGNTSRKSGGSSSRKGGSSRIGRSGKSLTTDEEKITEKTDAMGFKTITRTYKQPRQNESGGSKSYSNTKKLGL